MATMEEIDAEFNSSRMFENEKLDIVTIMIEKGVLLSRYLPLDSGVWLCQMFEDEFAKRARERKARLQFHLELDSGRYRQ